MGIVVSKTNVLILYSVTETNTDTFQNAPE